uniref:Fe2OG dioxygenase domain-containing protein n=1 Tax=Strigamia maritima TaxID=126957 RepID=T1J5R8_STRMM
MNGMNYAICIRREAGFCGVQFKPGENIQGAFDLDPGTGVDDLSSSDAFCTHDALVIPAAANAGEHGLPMLNDPTASKFCGLRLNAVPHSQRADNFGVITTLPGSIQVFFNTDANPPAPHRYDRGFHLRFQQRPCTFLHTNSRLPQPDPLATGSFNHILFRALKSMDNKRRSNRIQGGWSKPVPTRTQAKPLLEGQSHTGKAFEYKESAEAQACRQKPPEINYNTNETLFETILSTTENGKSIIRYYPEFLSNADEAFVQLEKEEWEEIKGINRGTEFLMPRQMIWYGPYPYSFAGATLKNHKVMPPIVQEINELIRKLMKKEKNFNSVLINHYRDNKDSVDWHSDDETLFGKQPFIASISLGDTRNFELRQKPILPDTTYEYSQHVSIPLVHGSLLIMEGAVQLDWQHRLRKEFHTRKKRFNLTFRDCI